MAGTGLPIPKSGDVLALASPVAQVFDVDRYSSAKAWGEIAQHGSQLANSGADALKIAEHQAVVSAVANMEVEGRDFFRTARDRNAFNPRGFEAETNGYIDGKLSTMEPRLVPHARQFFSREIDAGSTAILSETRSRDQQRAKESVTALEAQSRDDVIGHAMTGTFNTDEGMAALEKYKGVLASAVTSQLLSPEEMDRRVIDVTNRATGEVIVKDIGDQYRAMRANGEAAGPAAMRAAEEQLLRSPTLNLSQGQRYTFYRKATAEIHALEAERKQDLKDARAGANDALYALSRGVRIDPATVDRLAETLNAAGGQADTARLRGAAARADQLESFNRLPLGDQARTIATFDAATGASAPPAVRAAIEEAAAATGVSPAYLFRTASRESRFDPNARATTSSAGGLFQFTDRTWSDTLAAHGAKYGLAPNTPKTDARASALMAAELTKANADALKSAGFTVSLDDAHMPVSGNVLYLAHFAGAEGATKLLRSDPGASAADVLPAAAGANRSLFYGTDGKPRAVGDVLDRLSLSQSTGGRITPAMGTDLRTFAGLQKSLNEKTETAWTAIAADMDKGMRPAPGVLDQVIQGATLANNHALLETVADRVERFDQSVALGRAPLPTQQSAIGELNRAAAAGELSPGAAAWKRDIEARHAAVTSGLDSNPVSTTVAHFPERFQQPAPLDVVNSDNFRAGLAARAQIARFGAQNWQSRELPALDQADLTRVHAALDAADPAGKTRIFSDLTAALPEGTRHATLAKLGEKGPAAMVDAFAGALYSQAPDVATGIITGWRALTAETRFDPLKDDKSTFNQKFDEALPASTFGIGARTSETGALLTIKNSARALYAYKSAQLGDTSGDINEARVQQSVEAVTGGVLKLNGGSLIAPVRGMSQRQFDGVVAGITDQDLAGVTTLSGQPITAAYLRGSAKLESVGDGRYLIRLGNDAERPIYAFSNASTESPTPYELDLRGRRPLPGFTPTPGVQGKPYPRG